MAELAGQKFSASNISGLGTPVLLLVLLAMMILPMPTFLLDILFTFNISLALIVLLATVYANRPLDFAVFPTILLVTTLMRLALNVASTRVVLINGHTGPGAAGSVIESFGSVVIGGNYAVGLVVFAILVIINFVVVTKGAGRISEVSARFTLDAMPGKQMAIDADLNAGLLTQEEARERRKEVAEEADFYGAMDGASKFVRGDAVAGLLILFINILGGVSIGMAQHGLDFSTAMQFYALLTIGDGLVAQIPALLLSTSAAIMVTRQNAAQNMGEQLVVQLVRNPRALYVTSGVLAIIGIIPGMPHVAFLLLALAAGSMGYMIQEKIRQHQVEEEQQELQTIESPEPPPVKELSWEDVPPVDQIGLEVGYRLIPMVDPAQDGKLMGRIKGVRKKISQELGFLISPVHIRDNLDLSPNAYRIAILGATVGEAEVYPDKEMAINPGQVFGNLQGIETKDPAFGLDAVWIDSDQKDNAQALGYTVVDASTVIATHLSHLIQNHSAELFGHEEAEQLLKGLAKSAPKLAETLVPDCVNLGTLVKVLQNLLLEQVPIKDMRTIAETLAEFSSRSQDPAVLTAAVRVALSRLIIQNINGLQPEIPVVTLAPELEQILQQTLVTGGGDAVGIEPGLADRIQSSLKGLVAQQEAAGQPAILLTAPAIRPSLAKFARFGIKGLHVLSYQEIPDNKQIKVIATVGNSG
ncbi:flagellar biosynthesis protein FlhA [Aliikangiella coralliicola]|uniref:Flagellar biosynthesis protein FlhA n=1 Tax=Aliikangiella coralliicola TaxID=2592383 RepID=A0A545UB56_9GAMM|nr:flagellar biosynthesis protein FlhA [Aliikangiella coralliicola]TQV86698.1 flagellar biosynthesis protein FlhA [Aliikangiella coralliicola]